MPIKFDPAIPTHISKACPKWQDGHYLAAFRNETTCLRCKNDFGLRREMT